MRKIFIFSFLIISSLGLTSCLDIFENLHFNKDGSGKYSFILTIGEQFRQTVAQSLDAELNKIKKEADVEDTEEIQAQDMSYKETLEQITEQLKSVNGLSNIQVIYNETSFEFGYEFDFENMQALNRAFEVTAGSYIPQIPGDMQVGKKKKTISPIEKYIETNKNIVIRHQSAELGKILDMKKSDGNNSGMMGGLDVAYLLQDMNFKTTFTFEQGIKSVSNESAVIDDKNKTVVMNCKPFAYKPSDLNLLKLQEAACAQSVQIELK